MKYLRKRWLILLLILGEDDFPSETIQILTDHDEEVKYFFIFKEICQNIWKMDQITLPLILGILVVFCVPHEIRQLKFSINVCFRISTIWLFFEGFFTPFEKMKKKVWMSSNFVRFQEILKKKHLLKISACQYQKYFNELFSANKKISAANFIR